MKGAKEIIEWESRAWQTHTCDVGVRARRWNTSGTSSPLFRWLLLG
jgi:hypothetical protein